MIFSPDVQYTVVIRNTALPLVDKNTSKAVGSVFTNRRRGGGGVKKWLYKHIKVDCVTERWLVVRVS